MAGERDVLAEALREKDLGRELGRWNVYAQELLDALAARGYTLSRSEPTIGDCSCVDAGASGHRVPCRAVAPSPEPLPLDGLSGELLHNLWVLSGRPDPFAHDGDAWSGFALAIRAALDTYKPPPAALREDRPT